MFPVDRPARTALALAWAMGFAMWGLLLAVTAVLPSIQGELGLSFTVRSLVLALPFLSIAIAAVPGGYLADRRGTRWTVTLGSVVAISGAALRAAPGTPALLLAASSVFGIGLGLVIPNLPKLVSTRFDPSRSGVATGVYSTGLIAGSAFGVYFTAPLAAALGSWRAALVVWAIGGAVVAFGWWAFLAPEPPRPPQESVGYAGVLRRRSLWVLSFLFAAGNASYFFLVGGYPDYLQTRGMPEGAAVGQLSLLIAVGIPAIFLAPVLSERFGRRRPFLWGPHLAIAALLFALPAIPPDTVWLASVGLGFAEMGVFALALLLPVDLFPPEEVGRASGIAISVAYVGALLGPLALGLALDLTGSHGLALGMFGAVSLLAAGVTFALPETGAGKKV
jgi:cyanate permease